MLCRRVSRFRSHFSKLDFEISNLRSGALALSRRSSHYVRHAPRHGERGSALFECAAIIPLLLFTAMSLIDSGIALRNKGTITEAARYGARVGSENSITDRILCNPSNPRLAGCSTLLYENSTERSVATDAQRAACRYLQTAGLNIDDWDVSAVVSEPEFVSTSPLLVLRSVSLHVEKLGRSCLLCYMNSLGGARIHSRIVFTLADSGKCI